MVVGCVKIENGKLVFFHDETSYFEAVEKIYQDAKKLCVELEIPEEEFQNNKHVCKLIYECLDLKRKLKNEK